MPMILALRYPWAGLRSLRKPPVALLDESSITMRVRPSDCDSYLHVNNGRYLSLMDLGRIDHVGRAGMVAVFKRLRWQPVAGGATIRFRREMRIGTRYTLRTSCVGWDDGWIYFQQVFDLPDGRLAARAYVKVAVLDEHGTRLPTGQITEALGVEPASPPLPEGVLAWQASEFG